MNKVFLEKTFNDDLGTAYFPILAEKYILEEDYMRARHVCDIGLLLNSENNDGKFILAQIEIIENKPQKAIKLLNEIIISDSLYINALKMLLMIYKKNKINHNKIIKISEKILDFLPGDKFTNNILKSTKRKKQPIKKKQSKPSVVLKKKSIKMVKSKTMGKSNDAVDSKMATLTFVDILIQQNQYQQAGKILDLIRKKKTVSKNSIKIRMDKIINGLSESG